jgi:hypothetical protein
MFYDNNNDNDNNDGNDDDDDDNGKDDSDDDNDDVNDGDDEDNYVVIVIIVPHHHWLCCTPPPSFLLSFHSIIVQLSGFFAHCANYSSNVALAAQAIDLPVIALAARAGGALLSPSSSRTLALIASY